MNCVSFTKARSSPGTPAVTKPLDGDTLRIERVVVADDGKKFTFVFGPSQYEYDTATSKVKLLGAAPPNTGPTSPEAIERLRQQLGDERVNEMLRRFRDGEQEQKKDDMGGGETQPPTAGPPTSYKNYSPDKKKYAYLYKFNLYVAEEGQPEEKALQLSSDGVEDYTFESGNRGGFGGGGKGGFGKGMGTGPDSAERKTRANVIWAPNSQAFAITRNDNRGVKELYLVDSMASPRPKLEQYKYAMPGEEVVRRPELYFCDLSREKKSLTRVMPKWKDEHYFDVRWGKNSGELRFIRRDRLQRNLEVCSLNVTNGACKCQFGEGFDSAFLDMQVPRYVEETDDMIWWSERSGWGHFYRYGRDGTFKNALTSGAWRASRIVEVDGKNGFVYFHGNAREEGENPYFTHLYRVKLDGSALTCLDPSEQSDRPYRPAGLGWNNGNPAGGFNQTSYLSPSKKYVVVNSTKVDHAPFVTLRNDSGQILMFLAITDLAAPQSRGLEDAGDVSREGGGRRHGALRQHVEAVRLRLQEEIPDHRQRLSRPADGGGHPSFRGLSARRCNWPSSASSSSRSATAAAARSGPRPTTPTATSTCAITASPTRKPRSNRWRRSTRSSTSTVSASTATRAADSCPPRPSSRSRTTSSSRPPWPVPATTTTTSTTTTGPSVTTDSRKSPWATTRRKREPEPRALVQAAGPAAAESDARRDRRPRKTSMRWSKRNSRDILESFDPRDEASVEELERRLAELKATPGHSPEDAARDGARRRRRDMAGAELAKVPPMPKTKFEIQVPTNAELAANLKGHLLLVHGEIDNNVHPANTMRLVDALIKANKRFDLLIIPGARHAYGIAQPYFTQRMWDFFAEHLLNDRQTGADINLKDVKRR